MNLLCCIYHLKEIVNICEYLGFNKPSGAMARARGYHGDAEATVLATMALTVKKQCECFVFALAQNTPCN